MTEFDRGQKSDQVPEHIKSSNFLALKRFLDASAVKHSDTFGKFYLDDPTTMGFSLWFDPSSPLFNTDANNGESAYQYLVNRGETVRANKLNRFIAQMLMLAVDYPHFFLSLSGLGNIYEFPSGKSTRERTLTVTTNESMDLRMASIIDNYVQATYDIDFGRRAVPLNLTEFKMKIFISEIRSFQTFVGNQVNGVYKGNFKELNDSLGIFIVNFKRCTFNFSASNPFLDTINNSQQEIASNVFSIDAGDMNLNNNKVDVFDIVQARNSDGTAVSPIPTNVNTYNDRTDTLAGGLNKGNVAGGELKDRAVGLGDSFKSTITENTDNLKNELSDKLDKTLTEYNPLNIAEKMATKYFTDVIDSKFKRLSLGNVFYPDGGAVGSALNLAGNLIDEVLPEVGAALDKLENVILGGDASLGEIPKNVNNMQDEVFNIDNVSAKDLVPKQDALFKTLTEVFDNAENLTPQQIDTVLEFFAKSNLGNVFNSGGNIS